MKGVLVVKIKTVLKNEFTVIGKIGQGLSKDASDWVPRIWEGANKDFDQIKTIILYNNDGGIKGLWGIMSDVQEKFEVWNENGKYLAGCEADKNAIPPEGWTKWTIPAQTYLSVACSNETYGDIFNYIKTDYIIKNNLKIAGAIHEHYPEPGNPNNIELYFPVKKR
ncbi:MAG: effector-binding protein [Clostridia bacterium]|nr:effector-binding protein [Clostridia bacterium]